MHWRDKRAATDWPGLKEEVRRWQAADRLGWSEADVVAVARYLNETVYHLPQTGDGIGSLLVRTAVYDEVHGLDEEFTVAYNDVDFCLRVPVTGCRNPRAPRPGIPP